MKKVNDIKVNRDLVVKIGCHAAIIYSTLKELYGKSEIVNPVPALVKALEITAPTARRFLRTLEGERLIEKVAYKDRCGFTYKFSK